MHSRLGEGRRAGPPSNGAPRRRPECWNPMDTPARRHRRDPRTLVLYGLAVLRMFRGSLFVLLLLVVGGAILYKITPQPELGGATPPWKISIYGSWMALLAQPIFGTPDAIHLEL